MILEQTPKEKATEKDSRAHPNRKDPKALANQVSTRCKALAKHQKDLLRVARERGSKASAGNMARSAIEQWIAPVLLPCPRGFYRALWWCVDDFAQVDHEPGFSQSILPKGL